MKIRNYKRKFECATFCCILGGYLPVSVRLCLHAKVLQLMNLKKKKKTLEISNCTGVPLVGAGSPAPEGILCGLPERASAGCSSLTWGRDSNLGTAVGEAGVAGGTKRLSLRCASATALVISCGCARLLTVSLADVELALGSFSRTFALKDLLE